MQNIQKFGWDDYIQHIHIENKYNTNEIARISSVKGQTYHLQTNVGFLQAELSGKMLYAMGEEGLPVTGDWVKYLNYGELSLIVELLPRINSLFRRKSGSDGEKQFIGANIHRALVVQGADQDFNINRIERYLYQLNICHIEPAIILNKIDLTDNLQKYLCVLNRLDSNVPVFTCSAHSGEGLDKVKDDLLLPGKTFVMLGSSGVGKSSLLNAIMGNQEAMVSEQSQSTGKGRHTTTYRSLHVLPNGAVMMDTPGMREFGIADAGDDKSGSQMLDALAKECAFGNCSHTNEKGCAVLQALNDGELDENQYNNYMKMQREQEHFALKASERRKKDKAFGKMAREVIQFKKRNKY